MIVSPKVKTNERITQLMALKSQQFNAQLFNHAFNYPHAPSIAQAYLSSIAWTTFRQGLNRYFKQDKNVEDREDVKRLFFRSVQEIEDNVPDVHDRVEQVAEIANQMGLPFSAYIRPYFRNVFSWVQSADPNHSSKDFESITQQQLEMLKQSPSGHGTALQNMEHKMRMYSQTFGANHAGYSMALQRPMEQRTLNVRPDRLRQAQGPYARFALPKTHYNVHENPIAHKIHGMLNRPPDGISVTNDYDPTVKHHTHVTHSLARRSGRLQNLHMKHQKLNKPHLFEELARSPSDANTPDYNRILMY